MNRRPRPGVRGRPSERGFSILEVLISSVIFLIGFAGLAAMHTYAAGFDGHAQKVDQATTVAWDLLNYLEHVPWTAARPTLLADSNGGNDGAAEMRDVANNFTKATVANTYYDHNEADLDAVDALTTGGDPCASMAKPKVQCPFQGYASTNVSAPGSGRPTLDFNGNGKDDFNRYWLVKDEPDGSGKIQGVLISVVVRWRTTTGTFQRVVLTGYRANPTLMTLMP